MRDAALRRVFHNINRAGVPLYPLPSNDPPAHPQVFQQEGRIPSIEPDRRSIVQVGHVHHSLEDVRQGQEGQVKVISAGFDRLHQKGGRSTGDKVLVRQQSALGVSRGAGGAVHVRGR